MLQAFSSLALSFSPSVAPCRAFKHCSVVPASIGSTVEMLDFPWSLTLNCDTNLLSGPLTWPNPTQRCYRKNTSGLLVGLSLVDRKLMLDYLDELKLFWGSGIVLHAVSPQFKDGESGNLERNLTHTTTLLEKMQRRVENIRCSQQQQRGKSLSHVPMWKLNLPLRWDCHLSSGAVADV